MMILDNDTRPPSLFLIGFFYFWVLLLLLIALLNQQWELTLLGFLIVGMVSGVKMWSRFSLNAVHCKPNITSDKLFPGDAAEITIRLRNAKPLPIWIQLRMQVDSRLQNGLKENYFAEDAWLMWYQTLDLKFQLPARRRGVYTIGPFILQGGDLLGFYSRGKRWETSFEVVIYPRVKTLKPIHLPRRDFFGIPGAKHPVEDPLYLMGTRDYQHQRPAKFIHWKASARLNRLQEKFCEPSSQMKVLLVVDVVPFETNEAYDAFEEMLSTAASLAIQMHRRGLAIGFITNGKTIGANSHAIPVGPGTAQLSRILEILARLEMQTTADIQKVLFADFRLCGGVSYAHFSYLPSEQLEEMQKAYRLLKLPGAFFVRRPNDTPETKLYPENPNTYFIQDIGI